MFFFWQVGLVDTYSLIQFCIKTGSQYGAIVLASAAGNFSDIGPKANFQANLPNIIVFLPFISHFLKKDLKKI